MLNETAIATPNAVWQRFCTNWENRERGGGRGTFNTQHSTLGAGALTCNGGFAIFHPSAP
jgi:hypothetical protein